MTFRNLIVSRVQCSCPPLAGDCVVIGEYTNNSVIPAKTGIRTSSPRSRGTSLFITGFPRIGPVLAEAGIRGRLKVALRLHRQKKELRHSLGDWGVVSSASISLPRKGDIIDEVIKYDL